MKSTGDIIKELRLSKKLSQPELAEMLNISASMLGMIEQGRRKPSDETKIKICNIFNVSLDYLMNYTSIKNPKEYLEEILAKYNLTEKEYNEIIISFINDPKFDLSNFTNSDKKSSIYSWLYSIYYNYLETGSIKISTQQNFKEPTIDMLQEHLKPIDEAFISLIKSLDKNKIIKNMDSAIVFVYGTIPAGLPMECIEDIIDTEEISADMLKGDKQYFGLQIKGNSMFPTYLDGDTIILEKTDDCESGEDCVVMVNGNEGTFKKVIKDPIHKTIRLQPINTALGDDGKPLYEPITYTEEQIENLPVRIIGVEVELRRKNKKRI